MKIYKYQAYLPDINNRIVALLKESVGIRGIGRILKISPTTVIKRIKLIASTIQKPTILINKVYEMDELKTFVKHKDNEMWVIYAIDRDSRKVADLKVGKRNKKNIKIVADSLLLAKANKIYTDRLEIYKQLIPKNLHITKQHPINHIERKNLNLRTHLKRLARKTICFSRSVEMLAACVMIYFFSLQA